MRENDKLKKIQETELEILTEFDRICRKHGLTYFLDSGTALGAVRHGVLFHGMMILMWACLEKIISIAPPEMDPAFFLQNKVTDPKSPYYFAKSGRTIPFLWSGTNGIWIFIMVFILTSFPMTIYLMIK